MKYIILFAVLVLLSACACPQEWASGPGYCDRLKLQERYLKEKEAYYAAESDLEKEKRKENGKYCIQLEDETDGKSKDSDFFDKCMKDRGSPRFW